MFLWIGVATAAVLAFVWPVQCPMATVSGQVPVDMLPRFKDILNDRETALRLQPLVVAMESLDDSDCGGYECYLVTERLRVLGMTFNNTVRVTRASPIKENDMWILQSRIQAPGMVE
jgi:hypothetical protein